MTEHHQPTPESAGHVSDINVVDIGQGIDKKEGSVSAADGLPQPMKYDQTKDDMYVTGWNDCVAEMRSSQPKPSGNAGDFPKLTDAMADAAAEYIDAHGICIEPEQMEGILSAALAAQAQPPISESLPYEQALFELIDKIEPGLDTGDLLADAATASKALSARQTSGTALWVEQVDITDIPDAVLTEAGKQLKASQQASGQDRESRRATKEGEKNAAVDDYFKARTWVMDTTDSRRIFEAGFDCGYDARAAAKGDV